MRQALVSALILLLLSACAAGNEYDYRAATPELLARSSASVVVGVHDQRPYIVDNDKRPDFVGLQRGGFGNPFDVTTRSGAALADDFAQTIVDALRKNGIAASTVVLSAQIGRTAALRTMASTGAERSILVTLDEWKTDNFINVALIYNLSAEVLDKRGKPLAEMRLQGRDALGAGLGETLVGENVLEGYSRVLTNLLNDEEIVAVLAAAPSDSTIAGVPESSAKDDSSPTEPGSTPERDRAATDASQTAVAATTQSARSSAMETSESDRERVMGFIRNNDNRVKSRLASYNESKRIGRDNSPAFNIITIDHIFARTVDGDRATVELGFSSGYRSFPSYHKYLYDVQLSSGDIVFLGHQKL